MHSLYGIKTREMTFLITSPWIMMVSLALIFKIKARSRIVCKKCVQNIILGLNFDTLNNWSLFLNITTTIILEPVYRQKFLIIFTMYVKWWDLLLFISYLSFTQIKYEKAKNEKFICYNTLRINICCFIDNSLQKMLYFTLKNFKYLYE